MIMSTFRPVPSRSLGLATATLVASLLLWVAPARAERPEYDAAADAAASLASPASPASPASTASAGSAAALTLARDPALARLGRVTSWDEGAGVPSFLWAAGAT